MPKEKIMKTEELKLDDSVKVNKKGEAILGRLTGPCADIIHPTRNNRVYSEELWEKVFNNDIVKEYFDAGGILGELDHPADRLETCTEKVAICMPEPPVKDDEGHLIGTWDILDTPNGRIAYTLAKYGYKLGISSRGNGDVYENMDGTDRVDEDTYDFQAFDLVLLPAVKAARLKMVESLQKEIGKPFNQAICEALDLSDAAGRKVQEETLKNLKIDYKPSKVDNKEESDESVDETDKTTAGDARVGLEADLTEALKENKALKIKLKQLQERLSVCYAKETEKEEEIARLKNCAISLTESLKSAKALNSKLDSLQEQLQQKDKQLEQQNLKISKLLEHQKLHIERQKSLNESIDSNREKIKSLLSQNRELKESLNQYKEENSSSQRLLNERVEELKKDSALKKAEFDSKLSRANNLVERYQKMAKAAVDKLIESKATMLGISPNEIKSKLPNNYSFNDIDSICEGLQQHQVNLSKLPFMATPNFDRNCKVTVKESFEPIKPKSRFDDDVDDSLLSLAGLKK